MTRSGLRGAARQVLAGASLRVASMVAGVAANLLLFRWAFADLGLTGFGALAVIANVAFVIQTIDLGVKPALTNRSATFRGAGTMGVRELSRWTSLLAVASLVTGVAAYVTMTLADVQGIPLTTLGVGLVVAVVSNAFSVPSVMLIGLGRPQAFYAAAFAQPVFSVALGAVVHLHLATLEGFVVAIIGGAAAPGLVALLHPDVRRQLRRRHTATPVRSLAIARTALPLGIRQVSTLLAFGLVPTIAGVVGGAELAAEYAVPFRVYIALWSVVGVVYVTQWSPMAHAALQDDGAAVSDIARRVNLQSLALAAVAALACAVGGPLAVTLVDGGLGRDAIVPCLLAALALVARAAYAGVSLRAQVARLSPAVVFLELVTVLSAVATCLYLPGLQDRLRPGVVLVVAAVAAGLYIQLIFTYSAKGRSPSSRTQLPTS